MSSHFLVEAVGLMVSEVGGRLVGGLTLQLFCYAARSSRHCILQSLQGLFCKDSVGTGTGSIAGVCHSRERIGYKMSSYTVTGRRYVGSLTDCSEQCQKDSSCNSFSYSGR